MFAPEGIRNYSVDIVISDSFMDMTVHFLHDLWLAHSPSAAPRLTRAGNGWSWS